MQISLELEFSQPDVLSYFGKSTGNPCKHSWLIKAYRQVKNNPNFFNLPESAVKMGMTPRMLSNLAYWAKAFKIIDSHERTCHPTRLGNFWLNEEGIDPYLASTNSLWWLHFQMLQPPCHAPVWYWFFAKCNLNQLSKKLALRELERFYQGLVKGKKAAYLSADLDCLSKMYSANLTRFEEDELALGWIKLGLFSCYKDSEEQG